MKQDRKSVAELIKRIVADRPNTLNITFNDGWSCYASVEEEIINLESLVDEDINLDTKMKIIESNCLWRVTYYPRTPAAFYSSCSNKLEDALIEVYEAVQSEKIK